MHWRPEDCLHEESFQPFCVFLWETFLSGHLLTTCTFDATFHGPLRRQGKTAYWLISKVLCTSLTFLLFFNLRFIQPFNCSMEGMLPLTRRFRGDSLQFLINNSHSDKLHTSRSAFATQQVYLSLALCLHPTMRYIHLNEKATEGLLACKRCIYANFLVTIGRRHLV